MNGSSQPLQNGTDTKKRIEGNGASSPPEIPHITSNIIPLSNVLKFYTQEAYKQITVLIENLSSTQESESDIKRKKQFLELIISLRQDFIKIYTLVKWAINSKDVSRFIDLLNWFRMQEFHFEQLTFQLNALNSFSGAKLPNSDLMTALEVLIKKRPQLPSYNYIKVLKILPQKTLEVLHDLNLILMTRLALIDIPERFVNNYVIKDGRVFISVPNEFQIAITVANDLIIEEDSEYYKSPFYFVDFKFLFGINPETSLITHKDNKIVTKLPQSSHVKLEKIVNSTLLNQGLGGLYDLLHKYSISFKLFLIAKQLKDVSVYTKWRNNIQFNYQTGKSLIIINYWMGHYLSRNWKSFIEIGIDKTYNLNFRWFKNGKYVLNHGITDIFSQTQESNDVAVETEEHDESLDEPQDLSVDLILNTIVNKHSALLMSSIFETFKTRIEADESSEQVSYITPHQLLLKLSPKKTTIFAINPTTGFFHFIDPTPLQNLATKKINFLPTSSKNLNFVTELDMVNNIVENLLQLRLETLNTEIHNKLITTEWIFNDIIKLNDYETTKLFNFLIVNNFNFNSSISKIQFYRRKSWPPSWFLINMVSGIASTTVWWVSRIRSINGEWKIQWIQKLQFNKNEGDAELIEVSLSLDYAFFNSLSTLCSNMIIDHMILEELKVRKINFLKLDKVEQILPKYNIELPNDDDDFFKDEELVKQELELREKPLVYESILMLYNNNDLLPVYNSSTSLFLKIKLINLNNVTQMKIKLFGHLRNLSIKNSSTDFLKLNLTLDDVKNYFEINEMVNLSAKINGDEDVIKKDSQSKNLLDQIFNNLNKLNKLIKILDQLNKNGIQVVNNSVDDILINLDDSLANLNIKLPESSNEPVYLTADGKENNEFKLVLGYLNRYLETYSDDLSQGMELSFGTKLASPLIVMIKYLKEIHPILKSIERIKANYQLPENQSKLPNGLSRINFEFKVPTLNGIQFIFYLNYITVNSSKKIHKDKIVINLSFKKNKFDVEERNLIRVSLRENLNSRNLKYKKLFELIIKSVNAFDAEIQRNSGQVQMPATQHETMTTSFVKLNYDFLVLSAYIEELMVRISESFIVYLQAEAKKVT